jgi:hypothetical protein
LEFLNALLQRTKVDCGFRVPESTCAQGVGQIARAAQILLSELIGAVFIHGISARTLCCNVSHIIKMFLLGISSSLIARQYSKKSELILTVTALASRPFLFIAIGL